MRLFVAVLATASLAAVPLAAHADTFTIFNASGTFDDGSTLGGYLVVDETTGRISSSDLILSGPSSYTFVNVINQTDFQAPGDYNVGDRNAASTEDFNFDLPDPSQSLLIGYNGGLFCSSTAPCESGRGSNLYNLTTNQGGANLVSGSLIAAPEPSSFALLGTGILGLSGFVRRRFAK